MSFSLSSSIGQRAVLFQESFELIKVASLIAGLAPHIVFFEDRMFKGQVVMNVRLLVRLFKLMLWVLLACAYFTTLNS